VFAVLGVTVNDTSLITSHFTDLQVSELAVESVPDTPSTSLMLTVQFRSQTRYFDFQKSFFMFVGYLLLCLYFPTGIIFLPVTLFRDFIRRPKYKTPSERSRTLSSLKTQLSQLLETGHLLHSKHDELATVSKLNFIKHQKLKYVVSRGCIDLNKSLYAWENDYRLYQESLTLGPISIFVPYVKLVCAVIAVVANCFLIVDLSFN
jgi:hypothetical protein